MIDYAAPLFDEEDPPSIDALRGAMQIAAFCWNAAALEMRGDQSIRQTLAKLTTDAPAKLRSVVRRLLEDRKKRFGAIPVLLEVDVTGTDLATARIVARAYNPPAPAGAGPAAPNTAQPSMPGGRTRRVPSPPGAMQPLDTVFFELAEPESRAWMVTDRPGLPRGTYVLRESYCTEPACDCRRVLLHVHHAESKRIAATINYGFEPPAAPFDYEQQCELDLLNPQGDGAPQLLLGAPYHPWRMRVREGRFPYVRSGPRRSRAREPERTSQPPLERGRSVRADTLFALIWHHTGSADPPPFVRPMIALSSPTTS